MSHGRSSSTLHFSSGLITGIISASLLQPADLLKTRVQQTPHTTLLSTLHSISTGPNAIRSLWRGTLPSIIRTGFGSALYFSFLNTLRRSSLFIPPILPGAHASPSGGSKPRYSNTTNALSGALARTAAGLALMPVTVLKVRYESSLYAYTSLPSAFGSILRAEGPRAFFAGFGATAARDAPYAGLYVLFYEQARGRMTAALGQEGTLVNFCAGVVAAVAATTVTNPFDAVKTRLQLRPREYGNMVVAAGRMVREEGVRSLFDGLGLRVARKAMSSAIAWSLYEELVRVGEGKGVFRTL